MKRILILFLSVLSFIELKSQGSDTIFFDNFENGMSNWVTTGQWGVTTLQSYSPTRSLSESPNGNYGNNWNTYCTMSNSFSLIHVPGAKIKFWITYKIETGFDYLYVQVSKDNFQTYTTVATFNGETNPLPPFQQAIIDIGAFSGFSNIKVRFHFYSDQGYVTDGVYIDDFLIIKDASDLSPPLIVHSPLPFMEGSLGNHVVVANISDYSGINLSTLKLHYSVDNVAQQEISGTSLGSNNYSFTIPAQPTGSHVSYKIYAEDLSYNANSIWSPTFEYISGHHIIQDNGQVDYFMRLSANQGVAVKVSLNNQDLVAMLIRNYIDIGNPNDSMLIHVWDNNNGIPGNNVITPFKVFPSATLTNTSPMTWIDLRSYSAQLSNLTGDYFIGFTVPTGFVNITITQPGNFGKSFFFNGSTWSTSVGSNGINDHHFRAVTSAGIDNQGPIIINNTIPIHYEASQHSQTINATITDISGVSSSTLFYKVDNGSTQSVVGQNYSGNFWNFVIPAQPAGSWVKYWITATDNVTPTPFSSLTDTFIYVSGLYHKYDNNIPNVYIPVGSMYNTLYALAVKINLGANPVQLTTMLIRNYYSTLNPSNTPNDPMRIRIWSDVNGLPGNELITSFVVNSEAGPNAPMAMTRIDLRPYANQLSNLTGSIYVGITVDNGMTAILADSNNIYQHTYASDGTAWGPYPYDAQIRAVTSVNSTYSNNLTENNIIDVYPNPTSDIVNVYIDDFKNACIYVYSIHGLLLKKYDAVNYNTTLHLSDLSSGIYLITIKHSKGIEFRKIIKQ